MAFSNLQTGQGLSQIILIYLYVIHEGFSFCSGNTALCRIRCLSLTTSYICILWTERIMGTFFHARKPEILRKPGSVRIFGEAHGTLQKTPIIFSTKKKQHNSHWATLQLCTWLIPPAHSPCVGVEMRISRHCSAVVTGSPETSWLSLGWQPSLASLFPAVCTQWFAPIVLFAVAKKKKNK